MIYYIEHDVLNWLELALVYDTNGNNMYKASWLVVMKRLLAHCMIE